MKKISRSILASVFFHLLLLGIVLFFADQFWKKKFSGGLGNGNSPVWIGLGTQAGKNSTEQNPTHSNPKSQTRSLPSPTSIPKTSNTVSIAPEKSLSPAQGAGGGGESAGTAGGGSGGVGSGGNGGGSDIKLEILRKIQRMKHYPALARARNWEGVVEVEFLIAPSGNLEKISVAHSSGFPVLDEEALATVRRAQPLPYYSSVLKVPIRFNLDQ